jgi:hypothetical protein
MSSAVPRDRSDHATSLPGAAAVAALVMVAALALQLPPQRAAAQSPPCTAIEDDAERLRCYDQALRSAPPPAPAPTAQTPTAPPAQSASVNASSATAAPAPAAAATPPPQQTPQQQTPQQQTPQQSADKESIPLVIVGVRTLQGRETIFTTQDGATWVQNDSQRIVGLPAAPFDAELKRGAIGSQFLVPKNGGRAIRVREGDR